MLFFYFVVSPQEAVEKCASTISPPNESKEVQTSCLDNPEVLELKRKIEDCDTAAKKLKGCASRKVKDISSCYQEARTLCPSYFGFLEDFEFIKYFDEFRKIKECRKKLKRCKGLVGKNRLMTNRVVAK
jgi:hypothetical protein